MKLKRPEDLTDEQLACIVGHLQDALYRDSETGAYSHFYTPGDEDFAQLREIMTEFGMAPPDAEALEKGKKREELAGFVGELMGAGLEDTPAPVPATFVPPAPLAAEEIKRGDLIVVVDGKIRLHDRGEAVKRLLAEYYLWSGGFKPGETSFAERDSFLSGRELDRALSLAMWPDAPERQVS